MPFGIPAYAGMTVGAAGNLLGHRGIPAYAGMTVGAAGNLTTPSFNKFRMSGKGGGLSGMALFYDTLASAIWRLTMAW